MRRLYLVKPVGCSTPELPSEFRNYFQLMAGWIKISLHKEAVEIWSSGEPNADLVAKAIKDKLPLVAKEKVDDKLANAAKLKELAEELNLCENSNIILVSNEEIEEIPRRMGFRVRPLIGGEGILVTRDALINIPM